MNRTVALRRYYSTTGLCLAVTAFVLAFSVVGIGAYTRLVHAGLGCPDWPGCYGFITVPESEEALSAARLRYPDSPVEIAKGWVEMIHRYLAGLLLILVLAIVVHARYQSEPAAGSLSLPLLILSVIILQALFGMWTVTLKLWPQVVTGHLLGGVVTVSLLFLHLLGFYSRRWTALPDSDGKRLLRRLCVICLIVVMVQITLGGWTSANYAALACSDLPRCQGQWLPETDFATAVNIFQPFGPNCLGGRMDAEARTAVHLLHRAGAAVTFCSLLVLSAGAVRLALRLSNQYRRSLMQTAALIAVLLLMQVTLGVSNVLWRLPLSVAISHNLCATLLLLAIMALAVRLSVSKREVREEKA